MDENTQEADMAWVRFKADFDYQPTPRTTIAYLTGMEVSVRRECADLAVAAGAAEVIPTPARSEAAIDPVEPTPSEP